MKKILVIATFPAPYRVGVFKGLAEKYDLDIFFERTTDDNRSEKFFEKKEDAGYYLLSDSGDRAIFENCISNIKKYDLVLGYDWYLKDALRAEVKCMIYGIPYIINCDGAFIKKSRTFKNFYRNCLKRFFIPRAKLCFSSGESATKYFKYYGAKDKRIVEHPFSSLYKKDLLKAVIPPEKKKEYRCELGLAEDKKMVLSVGQFIPRKAYTVLLESWREFDENYQLVLVGGGKEKNLYQSIIKENGYQNVCLVDFKPKNELIKFYYAADLFVLPTIEDIWGLVINEAMSVGLPVVSTDKCNAAIELIRNKENGYVAEANSSKSLAYGIDMCLNDKCNYAMGKRSLEIIQPFTIESVVNKHIQSIEMVIGENNNDR